MDVGGTHVSAANVDLGTRSIIPGQSVRLPLESDATAEHFVTALCACAALLPTRPGRDWSIALPGPFDYERGIAHYEGVGKFDALRGYDVRAALTARLPGAGRIRFHNDADAFGLGEWWVGAARGCRRVVGVTLGTGIGSCFVEGGRAVAEGPGIAPDGRIDQLLYEGRPLEETVSRRAVRRAYAQATGGEPADVDVKEIAQLARRGDRAAAAIFERAFRALGNVLAPVLAAFEPEMLVVGGSIAGSWDLIAKPLLAGIGEADLGVDRIALEPALYPAAAPLLGAAYLASRESR
jgi:glucokinase